MKFTLQCISGCGARLGALTDVGRHGDKVWKTPMCFVYTRRGCIPHLTHETLQMLTQEALPLVLPLVHLVEMHDAVKEFTKGIGTFVGLQEHFLYVSMQDPSITVPSGYNNTFGVALWPKTGRIQCDVKKFMSVQEAFCPDLYQPLCDNDTDRNSSKKRVARSVDRTLEYLDQCIEIHSKSERLKQTAIFGTIEGGFDVGRRVRSAKLTAERPVAGFIIDGFNNYGPETVTLEFDEIKEILTETLKHIPTEKPRLMHLVWRPDNVIRAVELGIDLFDASYPSELTDRGSALVLPLNYSNKKTKPPAEPNNGIVQPKLVQINLKDEIFKTDFSPIDGECECYTCRRFNRAYINHLLTTSEMLAQVLLIIHNLHHYLTFFGVVRNAIEKDEFPNLKDHILSFDYS